MSSRAQQINAIIVRELTSLRAELDAYPADADVWRVVPGITNSAGNLALHLAGNLRHFIGGILGRTGYRRDRDAEFASTGVPRPELTRLIDAGIAEVERTMGSLSDSELEAEFPEPVAKVRVQTGDFLMHLASHLAYHLGQVDYHRRIVTGTGATIGAVAPGKLSTARPVG